MRDPQETPRTNRNMEPPSPSSVVGEVLHLERTRRTRDRNQIQTLADVRNIAMQKSRFAQTRAAGVA